MTHKTTMPEPVVVKYATKLGKYTMFQSDDSRVRKKEALYTDDQMEAYANARVRAALEQAAVVAERSFCDCCCSDDQKFTAEDTAQSIRALIPKEI